MKAVLPRGGATGDEENEGMKEVKGVLPGRGGAAGDEEKEEATFESLTVLQHKELQTQALWSHETALSLASSISIVLKL